MTKTGYGYAKCLTVAGTATSAPLQEMFVLEHPETTVCHIPYLTSNTSSPTPTFRTYLRPLLRRYFYLTSPDPFRCYATIIIVSLHFYLPLLSPVPYCPLLSPYLVTSDLHSDLHSYLQHPHIIIFIIYPLVTCSDHLRITPSCPHI